MLTRQGFYTHPRLAIIIIIFLLHTSKVFSQVVTVSSGTETDVTEPSAIIGSNTATMNDNSITSDPNISNPTGNADTVDPNISNPTENADTVDPNTATSITPPITTTKNPCPHGGYPFHTGCITADQNGGVVIAAFILSILSCVGAIGILVYLIFFRKYFTRQNNHKMIADDVKQHEMMTLPKKTDNNSSKVISNNQHRDIYGASSRKPQQQNVLDAQSAVHIAHKKHLEPSGPQPRPIPHRRPKLPPANVTNLNLEENSF
ncbi:unnamed protein product [Rotaria magnacalcarata]|uniref:Uncharacterized protein n=3 Tax=Rotaria magnacalcarata TaxID=392030 RepID=A0A816YTZ0_9BILA|nr:unnamed protein product [Rotaria magnacalcarata]CAF1670571.1 unnamed protein product [Rotaria magnacalcarata]CAF2168255.1 unnamed protein product [Rotaria magnacalcarata]CAF4087199.1 unnamed protein product [Rotaria magnacalcarata]